MQLQKIAILHKTVPKSVVVQRKIGAPRWVLKINDL